MKTITLPEFPLSWRWTDPKHNVLPSEILKQITPLSSEAAAMLSEKALNKCHDDINGIRIEANEKAKDALCKLEIDGSMEIYISWDNDTAVITNWSVFVNYWDAFCYPSSDDVTIWPPSQGWTLCYFHYELFIFKAMKKAEQIAQPDSQ